MARTKRPAHPKPALRAYRNKHELDSERAGKRVGIAGSTWRSYENGWREMDGDTCKRFEDKLGIDRAELRPDLFEKVEA
jgi:DNA-binding XRE family transcriptional regulator